MCKNDLIYKCEHQTRQKKWSKKPNSTFALQQTCKYISGFKSSYLNVSMLPKTFTAPILLIGIINAGERSLIKNNNTAMYNSAMKH